MQAPPKARALNDDRGFFFLGLVIVVSVIGRVLWFCGSGLRKGRHRRGKDAGGAKQQRGVEAVDHIGSFGRFAAQGCAGKD